MFGLEYPSREIRATLHHLEGPGFVAGRVVFHGCRHVWVHRDPGPFPGSARLGVDMNKRLAIEQEAVTA